MEIALELREKLREFWLPEIYRNKIRTMRTRAHNLGISERENPVEIQHTLLGVELKVGNVSAIRERRGDIRFRKPLSEKRNNFRSP